MHVLGVQCYHDAVSLGVSDDESGEKSVSVLLDGEESELAFIDQPASEMSVRSCDVILFCVGNIRVTVLRSG